MKKINIFGVFPGIEIGKTTAKTLNESDIVFSGERNSELLNIEAKKLVLIKDMKNFMENFQIAYENGKTISIISSGDPLFFGIGRYISLHYPHGDINIEPGVSSVQVALSRINMDYAGLKIISLHGRNIDGTAQRVRNSDKVIIFTDMANTPSKIAEYLLKFNIDNYRAYVFENLGYASEKIHELALVGLIEKSFTKLNLLLLVRTCEKKYSLDDDQFERENNNITKKEIREISIGELQIRNGDILWDIGSGSGSISIHAAFYDTEGEIIAIEMNKKRCMLIENNRRKFSSDIKIVNGIAPGILDSLPDPDKIFIGGSHGKLASIIKTAFSRLKEGGIMVINTTTLENLNTALETLKNIDASYRIIHANISVSREISSYTMLFPIDPVYIIKVEKNGRH
ncbi:MAG: precorrin-6y C5,15-methyltransferase (decarboxylating) subunit CbiE [Ferroplasma sp.]